MIGLGIAFAVLIVYLIIRSNRKDVKIESPVCPKPVTPPPSTPLAHPYQKIIDKAAEVSFMLSGIPSTKRQWENIRRFAKMQY